MIQIIKCDYNNPEHCQAQIDLMRDYMADEMGGQKPLTDEQNKLLIEGLKNHPTTLTLLAVYDNKYVGLTNSFINFGTWAVKNFLNIHDVIVNKNYRGLGIGKKLIVENIRIAKEELDCAKLTLEVRKDNKTAQAVYKKYGFDECHPSMHFWAKYL